jgi:hypothetical protein
MKLFFLLTLVVVVSAHWNDPLADAIGFNNPLKDILVNAGLHKCYGKDTCANRWILCNRNWECDFDCMRCPVCGEGESEEFSETKHEECKGAGKCQGRVIMCPPLTYCGYSESGCPHCSPFS